MVLFEYNCKHVGEVKRFRNNVTDIDVGQELEKTLTESKEVLE